jgi:hypothetical protein
MVVGAVVVRAAGTSEDLVVVNITSDANALHTTSLELFAIK